MAYCTATEARILTHLTVDEMSDNDLNAIQSLFAVPQIDSRFRAEGYAVPFDVSPDAPPLVRSLSAMLTAAYAVKRSYTGHSPNECPWQDLLDEINEIFKAISKGDMEVIDIDGNLIPRTLATSGDMKSTTEGELSLFTLDDPPNIEEVMAGRSYVGR